MNKGLVDNLWKLVNDKLYYRYDLERLTDDDKALVRKVVHEGQKEYQETGNSPIKVNDGSDVRKLMRLFTDVATPYFDASFIDVTNVVGFYEALPKNFKGTIKGWDPKTVVSLRSFGSQLKQPVDFYNLATKLLQRTTNNPRLQENKPAENAMPLMNITTLPNMKRYVRTYKIADDLAKGKAVSYDSLYNSIKNIRDFMKTSPDIKQNIIKTIANNPKFAEKWGRKLIGCK